MHVIPVIDLQGGVVVRGAGGERAAYQPVVTPLSDTPAPAAIVKGFLEIYPFDTLYIADLDAIQGGAMQQAALLQIKERFPRLTLWVDCGIANRTGLRRFQGLGAGRAVLGSESLRDLELLHEPDMILSLDFKHGAFLGRPALLSTPSTWPGTSIAMSLDEVGASRGPGFQQVMKVASKARAGSKIYAAGGVRDLKDLEALDGMGISGALVSSALHAGRLRTADLQRICERLPE